MAKVKGYVSLSKLDKNKSITEQFRGEVTDIPVKFPKELGIQHPFSFEQLEGVYKNVGLIAGFVNKITDSIVGDFNVKADNPNAQRIISTFLKETNFTSVIRPWIKEGILKGSGFMELDLDNQKIQVLNANSMYVKRNRKKEIKGYNQFTGKLNSFAANSQKIIPFKPNQIAYLPINQIPGGAYGEGIVNPNMSMIDLLLGNQTDHHELIRRKAGAPIHVKVGIPGESSQDADIDRFHEDLQYMNNSTEWVTDGNVDMKVLDFGDVGKSLIETLMYDYRMLIAGMEVPEVLMGSGQLNEGIAKVQSETFKRKIGSMREKIESIIENQIFKPILNTQGIDAEVEFIWNLSSEEEINLRTEKLTKLLENFNIDENFRRIIQIEIANLLEIKESEQFLRKPEKGLDDKKEQEGQIEKEQAEKENPERKKEETKIKQPEVPGVKTQEKYHRKMKGTGCGQQLSIEESGQMSIREYASLNEMAGFNYSDYLVRILRRLKIDKFKDLVAISEKDLMDGLLSKKEINKLRYVLKEGFRKNYTIRQIETELKNSIVWKDRLKDGRITLKAATRPNMVARTETVRLSNIGLLDTLKQNKIEKVRFLAALSERTCFECEGLNGEVFTVDEGYGIIPVHPDCRCSFVSVGEGI